MPLASATPPPSASGARLTGDDTQHAIAWYYALLSLRERAGITSVAVEATNAGSVDDVVLRYRTPPDDYVQVKAAVSAINPATIAWLAGPTSSGGPSILQRFHRFYTHALGEGGTPRLQLITNRSIDPQDPILTLRDRTDRIADRLRRATKRRVVDARSQLASHLQISEDELCAFLDHLRIRTDASEATWKDSIRDLSVALGIDSSENAIRTGLAEVREWVKVSRVAKTPMDIEAAVDRLGLRIAEPWETLVVQALDNEQNTQDATVVLDWVDRFVGNEARSRRGLKDPQEWNTVLRDALAEAARQLRTDRILVRGQARLPVWFAVGTALSRTRNYHVAKVQNGALWSSDRTPGALPPLAVNSIREPLAGEPLALSIAMSADPSEDAARHLTHLGDEVGHLRIAIPTGVGSHALKGPDDAWASALALRDEVRRITAALRPTLIHLFLATPAAFALLVGHVWDRVPDAQTYEDLGINGYEKAFFIPN